MSDGDPRVVETHYDVLGVTPDAERPQIARAYRAAMRRLHPDVGSAADREAAAEEVFAVQEAWRILSDPAARAAYDGELSGPSDAWADLGWGVALDEPAPASRAESAPPAPADPSDLRRRREVADGERAQPWHTPFAPGAVPIPEPVVQAGPPPRGVLDWLLIVVATALGVATIVMGVPARDVALSSSTDPFGTTVLTAGLMFAACLLGTVLCFLGAMNEERGSQQRAAVLAFSVMMLVFAVILPWSAGLAATLLGLVIFGAVTSGLEVVVRRHKVVSRVRADEADRMTSYHRAAEWNRLREALRLPGTRIEHSHGAPCLDEPLRIRTEDPVTGETTVRDMGVPVPRGAWVVVDDRGSVRATAPPGALEAWLAAWPDAPAAASPAARR